MTKSGDEPEGKMDDKKVGEKFAESLKQYTLDNGLPAYEVTDIYNSFVRSISNSRVCSNFSENYKKVIFSAEEATT